MALLNLPNEIIIEIVENLDNEQDIHSMVRVNKRFHHLFDDYLYCYNIKHRNCKALFWAAKHGRESTARKLLHLGADVNVRNNYTGTQDSITPLHMAAFKGHLAIVKLLLEVGADPEARFRKGCTPLLLALLARHEDVARHIASCTSNLQGCLVDSTKRWTPLHVACRSGLWSCARYFLNENADVDAIDAKGMTPLHHALLTHVEGKFAPGPDEIFNTVMVLLEFRANRKLEGRPLSGGKPIAAYVCGLHHRHNRVRALFFDCANESLLNNPKHKPGSLQIGRLWMQSSHHVNIERLRGSRTSDEHQAQPDDLDLSSFPVLHSDNRPQISSPRTHTSDGPWSPSTIGSLIAGFSVVNEPDAPPIAERSAQVDSFPQLNSYTSKNHFETESGRLWADFGKPKGQPVAEEVISRSASSEKNPLPNIKSTKMRGKKIWQPLKF